MTTCFSFVRLRALVAALAALVALPACDSDEADTPVVGSYSATLSGDYEAALSGVAYLSTSSRDLPPGFLPLPGVDLDSLMVEDSYVLVLYPEPSSSFTFAPAFQFALSEEEMAAGGFSIEPPAEDDVLLGRGFFFSDTALGSLPWTADSGRVAFDTVTEDAVTGSFALRLARIDRPTFQRRYAEATGSFEAVVLAAP